MLIQRCGSKTGFILGVIAAIAGVLVSPGAASAQKAAGAAPGFEFSGAYSYIRARSAGGGSSSNVNGGSASVAVTFHDSVSLVADFGGYGFSGLGSGLSATMYTYLFGPRYTFHKIGRISPYAQVLLGGGRLNATSGSVQAGENGFAVAIGGGLNIRLTHHWEIRAPQVEYLMTRFPDTTGAGATQNNVRISAGLVYRFGGH